ncbi:hypothetical protein EP7_000203 [Isosphaeraceae bacterium EP7]
MLIDIMKQLGIVFGGTTAAVVVLAYLSRSLLTQRFARDMERHKAELKVKTDAEVEILKSKLKAQGDLEIERLKHDLRLQSFEHETRYRRLHEDVAKTISETYPLLLELYNNIATMVSPAEFSWQPSKDELIAMAEASSKKFVEYFTAHRLYYPKDLFKKIEDLNGILTKTANKFKMAYERDKAGKVDALLEWNAAWVEIMEKASPLFGTMHDDFQRILGFREREPEEPIKPIPPTP